VFLGLYLYVYLTNDRLSCFFFLKKDMSRGLPTHDISLNIIDLQRKKEIHYTSAQLKDAKEINGFPP
jgi:hypothetical protein